MVQRGKFFEFEYPIVDAIVSQVKKTMTCMQRVAQNEDNSVISAYGYGKMVQSFPGGHASCWNTEPCHEVQMLADTIRTTYCT